MKRDDYAVRIICPNLTNSEGTYQYTKAGTEAKQYTLNRILPKKICIIIVKILLHFVHVKPHLVQDG